MRCIGRIMLFVMVFCFIGKVPVHATVATQDWTSIYNITGTTYDAASKVVTDGAGNIYVTGTVGAATTAWNDPGNDILTTKYDSSGVKLWEARYNGPGNDADISPSIAVDANGNEYISGGSVAGDGRLNFLTLKYSHDGVQQWEARWAPTRHWYAVASSIAVDSNGNVYVTGATPYIAGDGWGGFDILTIKYDPDGNKLWEAAYDAPEHGDDSPSGGIALDGSGNVYVAGQIGGARDFGLLKYDSNGSLQWVSRYNGPGNNEDVVNAIALDTAGNIYLTGRSYGNGTSFDYATVKFNSDGVQQWAAIYSTPRADVANAISIDANGNIYVTGYSKVDLTGYGDYSAGTWNWETSDITTVKYDSNGNQQWVAEYNGPANRGDIGTALALDSVGNTYVTGYSQGGATGNDYVTIKYNIEGAQEWVQLYTSSSAADDLANSIAVDPNNNVYVTGSSNNDYVTVKYTQQPDFHSIVINNGDAVTSSQAVTLNLSATGGSGTVAFMRFSNDNSTWSEWETYSASKAWELTPGEGIKIVFAQFKDSIGNISLTYSDDITFDTSPPTGSVVINNGVPLTTSPTVTLTISASDRTSGVSQMCVSNTTTCSSWEQYATSKAWVLTSGDGFKTVYIEFKNYAGNISGFFSNSITLNTTLPAYYVRPDGSDSNNGLTNDPSGAFRTIQHAANVAPSGVVVEVQEGVYNEAVRISVSGTPDKRITFRGNGNVVLDGQNILDVGFGLSGSYIDVKNFEIRNYTQGLGFWSSVNQNFENLDIHHNTNGATGNGAGGEGGQYFKSVKVHHNGVGTRGTVITIYNPWKSGVTFEDCDFYENEGSVIGFAYEVGVSTISRSRFYNNPGSAIGSGSLMSTVNIINNVFFNNGAALTSWDDWYTSLKIWKNNIIINNGTGIYKSWADRGTVINDYNLVWNNTTNYSNISAGPHDITADPLFVSAAGNDFRIQPYSPALDAGENLGYPYFGAAPDIGVYELDLSGPDVIPPMGSVTINSNSVYTNAADVSLALSAKDYSSGVSQMRLSNDNTSWSNWEAFAVTKAWTLAQGDGVKTVYVQFEDSAGNISPSYSAYITLDTVPPSASVAINGTLGNNGWYVSNVTVNFTAIASGSGVKEIHYIIDGSETVAPGNSASATISVDGNRNINYFSVDNAGNAESPHSMTVMIDKTAPSGSVLINSGAASTNSTSVALALSASDNLSGVAQMCVSNAATCTAWESFATAKSWMLSGVQGTNTVYVQYKDVAGNVSTYTGNIIFDAIPPTGTVVINNGATLTSSTSVTLTLSASDNASIVAHMRFSNDNVNWSAWETYSSTRSNWILASVTDVMTVYAQFKDGAGNVSDVYSDDIFMDTDNDGWRDSQDCRPNDPQSYPGASEIKFDGIDQDCNGYDLTINITTATYISKKLTVEATSSLGATANLQLVGFGPMTWKSSLQKWTITVTGVPANPGTVTVSGIEGSISLAVTVK